MAQRRIDLIAKAIQVGMSKGLTAQRCYEILKSAGYSDEELHPAFLGSIPSTNSEQP